MRFSPVLRNGILLFEDVYGTTGDLVSCHADA